MAAKLLSSLVQDSPVLLAPTTLTDRLQRGVSSGSFIVADLVSHGLSLTGETTSNTLAEVLNITGPGVIGFLAIGTGTVDLADPIKWKIVIDGVTVLNRTSGAVDHADIFAAVGGFYGFSSTGVSNYLFFGAVPFFQSLVVSQAGDGTDEVQTIYSVSLT